MTTAPSHSRSRRLDRGAYTLLEVILTLFLSVFLIGMIGSAVDIYWRSVERAQEDVYEAQIARVVLRRIADDLRNTIVKNTEEIDTSLIPEDLLAFIGQDFVGGTSGTSGTSTTETLDQSETETLSADSNIPQSLGLYGESNWIQVDTLRLGYSASPAGGSGSSGMTSAAAPQSGLVTVAWFMSSSTDVIFDRAATSSNQSLSESLFAPGGPGLCRRELSRAATFHALEMGTLHDYESQLVPLSPEIEAIAFDYFDGSGWTTEWDTEAMGSLPVAVRVTIAITRQASPSGRLGTLWRRQQTTPEPVYYSLLVHMPGMRVPSENATTTTDSLLGGMFGAGGSL